MLLLPGEGAAPGEAIDLGDRDFAVLPATRRGLPDSLWGWDPKDRILFLSDACACFHPHTPGQSDHLTSEIAPPDVPLMQDFNARALHWPRFTDSTDSFAALGAHRAGGEHQGRLTARRRRIRNPTSASCTMLTAMPAHQAAAWRMP